MTQIPALSGKLDTGPVKSGNMKRIILQVDKEIAEKKRTPQVNPKTGKKRSDDKHSDLYTDEDPKGTITGLGFKDKKTALESIKKINNSNRKHAHKVQAMLVMIQRLKVAIERTKDKEKLKDLRQALKVYEPAFEKLKKKTKQS